MLCKTVFALAGLGFRLAFHKAASGTKRTPATWTSAVYTLGHDCLVVAVKDSIIHAVREDVQKMLKSNVISVKYLRTLCGRLVCVCGFTLIHLAPLRGHDVGTALQAQGRGLGAEGMYMGIASQRTVEVVPSVLGQTPRGPTEGVQRS